jgi:cytochrome P450/DNA-binding SARP family transcriptional activator
MRIRVLGPVEVRNDGHWHGPGTPKQRAILAALVAASGTTVSTDQLIDGVWHEDVPQTAVNLIQGHIARLRRALDDRFGKLLRTQTPGYRLVLAPEELDSTVFELLMRDGVAAMQVGGYEKASKILANGLSLWRGPAFSDAVKSLDVERECERLEQLRLTALEARVQADLELGRHNPLIPELQQLVDSHKLHEPFWGQLMSALYRSGRRADSLAVYERLRSVLDSELGVAPTKAIQNLLGEIIADGTAHDTLAYATRASADADGIPRQLPSDARTFTGHAHALSRLDTLLASDQEAGDQRSVSVIVITGPAGIGKTTLAIHWAHRNAHRFPDGQLYVNMHGFSAANPLDPHDAMGDLLLGVNVPVSEICPTAHARISQYRTALAKRRILLLVDNADAVDSVRPLIAGAPGSLIIVTSRNRLPGLVAIDGAQTVTVEPFTPEESKLFLRRRIGRPQVKGDARIFDELVSHCDGLPLALAAVVARCAIAPPSCSLKAIADELAGRAHLVPDTVVSDDASVDLRASLSWSYRTLTRDAAHLFRLLGQHADRDVSLPAAARLAGHSAEHTRRLLTELCCMHLLCERADGRFTMPDLLRGYAAELGQRLPEVPRMKNEDRPDVHRWLRDNLPVCEMVPESDGDAAFLITRYDDAVSVLTDKRITIDPRELAQTTPSTSGKKSIFDTEPPDHTRMRKPISDAFSNVSVERLRPRIHELYTRAIDAFAGRGHADLMGEYALPVPVDVFHEILGVPRAERVPATELIDMIWRSAGVSQPDEGAGARIDDYVARMLAYKRTHRGDDVVTSLITALESGELHDPEELHGMLAGLIGGGLITTVTLLASSITRMLQYQDQLRAVLSQRAGWDRAVEETLRYESVVQVTNFRYAKDALRIGDVDIPEGSRILVSLASANHDERRFAGADVFDIDRAQGRHIAFGHGRHFCTGAKLSRIEAELGLSTLFTRLTDLRLEPDDAAITWTFGPMFRGPGEIPVSFTPHG